MESVAVVAATAGRELFVETVAEKVAVVASKVSASMVVAAVRPLDESTTFPTGVAVVYTHSQALLGEQVEGPASAKSIEEYGHNA